MKSSRQHVPLFPAFLFFLLFLATAAEGARVDMKDPRRSLGREDGVRVDAQLADYNVGNGSPVGVTYQIENLTDRWIAVADRVVDTSYDPETQTIVLSIGAEVPEGNELPHLVGVPPGGKKTLTAGGVVHVQVAERGPLTVAPRYLQVRLNVLRDTSAFQDAMERQKRSAAPVTLDGSLFDKWLEANDSILLNAMPVRWGQRPDRGVATAENDASDTSPDW